MKTLNIDLPKLHKAQARVVKDPARFKVICAGRRWGKSRVGSLIGIVTALRGGKAWWVAPSYKMGAVGWDYIRQLVRKVPNHKVNESNRKIETPNNGWIQIRSADDPDSLRGEGLDMVILDECAFMRERAWTEALRPALSDRKGKAIFFSTLKGKNWFWRLTQQTDRDWKVFNFPTSTNPFIEQSEIEAARRVMPERIFLQEYECIPLDDMGGVFRQVLESATAEPLEAGHPAVHYVTGVDWGRSGDATVFAVIDSRTNTCVHLDRMVRIDYQLQLTRLESIAKRFPGTIIAEENAMGAPLIEEAQSRELNVIPFVTTNASKQAIIDQLSLAFEQRSIRIPNDPVLIGELQSYECKRLPSGLYRYSAPEGMHDDCVMSLAIAWSGVAKESAWNRGSINDLVSGQEAFDLCPGEAAGYEVCPI